MFLRLAKHQRIIASFLLINFLTFFVPIQSKALSSGPSQPETQQFAPAGMDNMVDPFTGDFSYNIPLMDVGGYPINLNYASGITPDAEATWVGLGWNLNVGAINRSVRGLPDDFAGDPVQTEMNVKPNETYGAKVNVNATFFDADVFEYAKANVGVNANVFYNTYNGMGISMGLSQSVSGARSSDSKYTANLGLNLQMGSESGVDITPTLGLSPVEETAKNSQRLSATSVGFAFNTRDGLKGMTLSTENGAFKKDFSRMSSGYLGFSTPTYTPTIQQSHSNFSFDLSASLKISFPPAEAGSLGFTGYYNGQFLRHTSITNPAYGYMYSGVQDSDTKLYDINREKDGAYHKKYTKNLAVTNYTYDIFQVSGQGISGTYRLHRGDFGSVTDPAAKDVSNDPSLGLHFGLGALTFDGGPSVAYYRSDSRSGAWNSNNDRIKGFVTETGSGSPQREKVYFKKIGEATTENDPAFFNDVQKGTSVLQYGLVSRIFGVADNVYKNGQSVSADNLRNTRPNKSTSFISLTAAEAQQGNILPIQNYKINTFDWANKTEDKRFDYTQTGYAQTPIGRTDAYRKGPHISEVRVTDQSGARYVYGVPAYNILQKEITFAVDPTSHNDNVTSGIVGYKDGNMGNSNPYGIDNYYNCVSTPANTHSYLLTCILSSDYVDSDGIQGPSDGDLGTYTKFNYAKLPSTFAWRTPMTLSDHIASFSDCMVGTDQDDKGNIVYGEKEVWYLHSIETPTHVAEFYLSDRMDGFGAKDVNGGIGDVALQKLDKIVLYAKADKWNASAEPIKTVYFSYSYSLCPGTVNSIAPATTTNPKGKGKLTLDKVWFTYGNSQKGVLNPYVFTYADQNFDGTIDNGVTNGTADLNPTYSHLNYDRWGTYKLNNPVTPNGLFPYTPQNDKANVDNNASVYALSTIQTPTGGAMHMLYEADDYAYVQDKKAMRMFKISADNTDGTTTTLYDTIPNSSSATGQKNSITIDLVEGFTPDPTLGDKDIQFQNQYIGDMDLMYFKVYTNVVATPTIEHPNGRYEYVPGYTEIVKGDCALSGSPDATGRYTKATIKLKMIQAGISPNVNPIARAGWMYAKMNLSRELKGLGSANTPRVEQMMYTLIVEAKNLSTLVLNFTQSMVLQHNSSKIDATKSFVKLMEPDQIKKGGGHRVKAIIMSDNWAAMKSGKENSYSTIPAKQTSYYGQVYDYSTTESGRTISSGVAAYEPIIGGEENPFRRPVYVVEKVPLAVDNVHFLEEPFGECFFPSPTVGYSKVVVTPLKLTYTAIINRQFKGNGTGKVEQEFYTAKDFPVYTERTDLNKASMSPNPVAKFMKFGSIDLVTCTQGYYIETNDMHGKPKTKRVYAETNPASTDNKPISAVEYRYKTANGKLDNTITTINADLTVPATSTMLGVEVDAVNDQREFSSVTAGGGADLNIKLIEVVIPLPIPTGFPDVVAEFIQFRSVVTTKVVNKYGILEQTIASDNGASIATKNLAWDAQTGEVLLTSLQNEFHDPIYTFNYPAHWAYKRMDMASKTEGMVFDKSYFDVNASVFNDGDELLLDNTTKAFVNYDSGSNQWQILNAAGTVLTSYGTAKVIRSGARNMASAPIGTVVMLSNPIQGPNIVFANVINAGASEYNETWKRMGCNCANVSTSTNPYMLGVKGNLRPLRSWTYLTDRYQKLTNNQMNIRNDGYYKDFAAFWQYQSASNLLGVPSNIASTKWQYVTQITNYNPLGLEIENKDALSRYLMAQYGYGRKLPVATSNNSQYKESGFDGFEDYDYNNCIDDHFSWRTAKSNVTNSEAHTGRNSIRVPAGQNLDIKKVILPCE